MFHNEALSIKHRVVDPQWSTVKVAWYNFPQSNNNLNVTSQKAYKYNLHNGMKIAIVLTELDVWFLFCQAPEEKDNIQFSSVRKIFLDS
ncbi:MAG: hypothetical protein HON76_13875 [Candidatus Scalindua sp.]|jgi:hypothetical protein|nr:hypothetical protein [Candidatus Scalindua sp.]MBT6563606.1 hypothetical protein [Candidatus Scalindua sp.]